MKFNDRYYPHPVLGVSDDIQGRFEVSGIKISSDSSRVSIENNFVLENETLTNLVTKGKAGFLIHVTCPTTMFRESTVTHQNINHLEIEACKLNKEVEINFLICASADIDNYSNLSANDDYSGMTFQISKGDILAYGGTARFFANKKYEDLNAVSSFMIIGTQGKKNIPMHNYYGGDKITVYLSKEDYVNYQYINSKRFAPILHSAIVLPSLAEAIWFLNSKQGSEYKDNSWYKLLAPLCEKNWDENPFKTAQRILNLPINRSFNTLKMIRESD